MKIKILESIKLVLITAIYAAVLIYFGITIKSIIMIIAILSLEILAYTCGYYKGGEND